MRQSEKGEQRKHEEKENQRSVSLRSKSGFPLSPLLYFTEMARERREKESRGERHEGGFKRTGQSWKEDGIDQQ